MGNHINIDAVFPVMKGQRLMNEAERSKLLAEQNDRFRKGDKAIPGTVVVTQGTDALDDEVKAAIFALVQNADDFDEGNDRMENVTSAQSRMTMSAKCCGK